MGVQGLNFPQFVYERPDTAAMTEAFDSALAQFESANDLPAAEAAIQAMYDLRSQFTTMYNLCMIRHTIDTRDAFYEQENNFFDTAAPQFEALTTRYYRALLDSAQRAELEAKWGQQLFAIAELSLKTFRPEVLEDLQEENRLSSEYTKLKATAEIEFEEKTYNLSSIIVKEIDQDRSVRRRATAAKIDWFARHSAEMERIFDDLVKVRHRIARKLGFDNFVGLGYARMLRTDYTAEMVAVFRKQIEDHIVPLTTRLYKRQAQRLGLEQLAHYDEGLRFPEGNPQPQGEAEWIIEKAGKMYRELSPDTDAFFRFMRERKLMNLLAQDGKATGGYCTYIDAYKAPFIFSNFNGTSGDIDVLTHEAGHAFQVYSSRHVGISEYNWPTYEACEIHSMSMEFFTWPWMEEFFGEATERYRFGHLSGALSFLPYGVAVDEFQHWVYEHPEASPAERNAAWRDLEKRYLPHRDYEGNAYLEAGGYWQKQNHIFSSPFYYIDYTLAQICAFQFWLRDRQDHDAAWADYVKLCRAGGSRSFLRLVELAGLRSPFDPAAVREVVAEVDRYLDEVDDAQI